MTDASNGNSSSLARRWRCGSASCSGCCGSSSSGSTPLQLLRRIVGTIDTWTGGSGRRCCGGMHGKGIGIYLFSQFPWFGFGPSRFAQIDWHSDWTGLSPLNPLFF